jgi:hypothetical protein
MVLLLAFFTRFKNVQGEFQGGVPGGIFECNPCKSFIIFKVKDLKRAAGWRCFEVLK